MNLRAPKVKDFCNEMMFSTERDCPIYDTIRWLDEYRAEHAIVVHKTDGVASVVGIVCRDALAETLMTRPDYDDLELADIMNSKPLILGADDDLRSAIERLEQDGHPVALVRNGAGKMVGTLAMSDVEHLDLRGGRYASAA